MLFTWQWISLSALVGSIPKVLILKLEGKGCATRKIFADGLVWLASSVHEGIQVSGVYSYYLILQIKTVNVLVRYLCPRERQSGVRPGVPDQNLWYPPRAGESCHPSVVWPPSAQRLASIYLSINTFSRRGVGSCFSRWLSSLFVTITLLLHSKQAAQLRSRRPIKLNARRWMLCLFLLPSLLAQHQPCPFPLKAETFPLRISSRSYGLVCQVSRLIAYWRLTEVLLFLFQLHYYRYLWKKSKTFNTINNKLSTFLKGPSWSPGKPRLGDHKKNPKVSREKSFCFHRHKNALRLHRPSVWHTQTQARMTQSIPYWRIHIFSEIYEELPHQIKAAKPL